jgi:hypothetical protein
MAPAGQAHVLSDVGFPQVAAAMGAITMHQSSRPARKGTCAAPVVKNGTEAVSTACRRSAHSTRAMRLIRSGVTDSAGPLPSAWPRDAWVAGGLTGRGLGEGPHDEREVRPSPPPRSGEREQTEVAERPEPRNITCSRLRCPQRTQRKQPCRPDDDGRGRCRDAHRTRHHNVYALPGDTTIICLTRCSRRRTAFAPSGTCHEQGAAYLALARRSQPQAADLCGRRRA